MPVDQVRFLQAIAFTGEDTGEKSKQGADAVW
jgi:hypothetical protein